MRRNELAANQFVAGQAARQIPLLEGNSGDGDLPPRLPFAASLPGEKEGRLGRHAMAAQTNGQADSVALLRSKNPIIKTQTNANRQIQKTRDLFLSLAVCI